MSQIRSQQKQRPHRPAGPLGGGAQRAVHASPAVGPLAMAEARANGGPRVVQLQALRGTLNPSAIPIRAPRPPVLAGTGTASPGPWILTQRKAALPASRVVQRFNDDFAGDDLNNLHTIARRMGMDPGQLSFKKSKDSTASASGNVISIPQRLLSNQQELEFVLGHELSHSKTRDTHHLFSLLGGGMAAAGILGTLYGGPLLALLAGGAGFAGEALAGGGLFNALITGASMGGMVGLGPLFGAFGGLFGSTGGTLGSLVGGTLGGAFSLPFIQKLLEIKSDLHAAKNFGAQGGIKHFTDEMNENRFGAPLLQKGNTILDPTHPPLSMRVGYLKLWDQLFGADHQD